jgi:hypothetical protein
MPAKAGCPGHLAAGMGPFISADWLRPMIEHTIAAVDDLARFIWFDPQESLAFQHRLLAVDDDRSIHRAA